MTVISGRMKKKKKKKKNKNKKKKKKKKKKKRKTETEGRLCLKEEEEEEEGEKGEKRKLMVDYLSVNIRSGRRCLYTLSKSCRGSRVPFETVGGRQGWGRGVGGGRGVEEDSTVHKQNPKVLKPVIMSLGCIWV